ncbi:MAG: hypothetical protein OCD01_02255 [Fibrobacterales bacterium]
MKIMLVLLLLFFSMCNADEEQERVNHSSVGVLPTAHLNQADAIELKNVYFFYTTLSYTYSDLFSVTLGTTHFFIAGLISDMSDTYERVFHGNSDLYTIGAKIPLISFDWYDAQLSIGGLYAYSEPINNFIMYDEEYVQDKHQYMIDGILSVHPSNALSIHGNVAFSWPFTYKDATEREGGEYGDRYNKYTKKDGQLSIALSGYWSRNASLDFYGTLTRNNFIYEYEVFNSSLGLRWLFWDSYLDVELVYSLIAESYFPIPIVSLTTHF